MNTFYHGDCLFVMEHDIQPESVDLIYLDPPFFTGKVQKATSKISEWMPDLMEISYEDSKKFWSEKAKDMQGNAPYWLKHIAVNHPSFASYLYYMMVRLQACHKVLKKTGSIYLHCDWRASHYLKMIMDEPELFGMRNFRNEIVWCFNGGGTPKKDYPRKHQVIFRYTKTNQYTFKKEYKEYKENTQCVGKHSTHSKKDINIDLKRGTPVTDWWTDFKTVTGWAKEKVGYPTQKPVALLERIIKASSNPGDIILDPFCGCGTAIVAAQKLGRQWIGIDISRKAYDVSKSRGQQLEFGYQAGYRDAYYISRDLAEVKSFSVEETKEGKGKKFEKWVNEFFKATKPYPDKGIDGVTPSGVGIQAKTFEIGYAIISQLVQDAKYHHATSKPVKKVIAVSQVGFDDKARQRKFEVEQTEDIEVELITPEEMLKL